MDNNELSFEEVAKKYPDFPRTIMRKIDTALRGVILTERALGRAKEEDVLYDASADFGDSPRCEADEKEILPVVGGVFFRDGTYVLGLESVTRGLYSPSGTLVRKSKPFGSSGLSLPKPYILDVFDGGLRLLEDENEPVEKVYFAPIPAYFGKKTSRGTPMIKVISSRAPNRITINISDYCHFFKEKLSCKYCSIIPWLLHKGVRTLVNLEDIYETVNEALEEEGGFTSIHLIAGSDPRGGSSREIKSLNDISRDKPYENEVNEYIRVLKTLQRCFGREKIPAQAIASAFPREQLRRLADAGLSAYRSNIEVWDEKLFQWICPGKAKYFGRQYWIDSILSAVEIFGRGNVSTQLVAGAELAEPYGFKTIEEALESDLEGVEFFAGYGVYTTFCILWVDRGSVFYREKQKLPPLEYYVRLAKGINEIRKKYKLSASYSGYRGDGFHLDMDLARLEYNE